MFVRNALALIGLVTVVNMSIKGYNLYIKKPLERAITEALDDEAIVAPEAAGVGPAPAADATAAQ